MWVLALLPLWPIVLFILSLSILRLTDGCGKGYRRLAVAVIFLLFALGTWGMLLFAQQVVFAGNWFGL